MLQPRKPLDLSDANEILNTKRPALDLSEAENILKKKDSTIPAEKLDLETSIGSSGGKGFPKIDTNSIAPGLGVQPKVSVAKKEPKSTIVNLEKPKEDSSFFDYLKDGLDTGIAIASKSIYDTPALIYDNVAGLITNPIFRAMGVEEDKLASSKKLANDLGFKNIPSEILKEKIKVSNEKLNDYALKNGVDPLTAIENGNYKGAAKLVVGTTVQSLPMMIVALLSGGSKTALTAIGLSTASTKNSELEESNPEMGLGTRILNANNAGIIEATTGYLFTGASGAVMKRIIADKGVEAGSKIIGKSFRSTIEKAIEKNPFVGALGEVVEESAVEFGNQLNDMSSGIRTEFDVHAIKNAGLSATGMGGLQTLGVYGAKGYVKAKEYAKLKATNKEVFKLRGEIANGNLSDENKALLTLRADRLESGNKKLLGTEIEKVKALPAEMKTELNALNVEFEALKSKFDDIDDADDIPDNLKVSMKEEIKIQASLNQKRKTEILIHNDGLVVDNDFSNFQGVDPDFDLENGKISSLPLKEQDRLNDLALQNLTGGDMKIKVTKEQVSKTANAIYANEQIQTTATENKQEAQPKAEVQKAEQEVLVPSVVEQTTSDTKEPVAEVSPVPSVLKLEEEYNSKDVEELVSLKKKLYSNPDIESPMSSDEKLLDKVIAQKFSDKNAEIIAKRKEANAGKEEGNITPDGNVPLGADNVGENGITEPETPIAKSVPSSVDGGENKGDAEVEKKIVTLPSLDDIADFINQTYLKDEQPKSTSEGNSGAKKRSPKKNIDVPESAGKSKTKEVVLDENGFVIVSKKGKTPLEKRKFKGDRKEAASITPSDARSVVLSFFAKGGKIASSYFVKPGELKARNNGINGIATTKAKDIDAIAHDLWESQENKVLKLDTEAYKEAIEEVVRGHNNIQDVVDSLLKYGEKEIQESPKERQENFQAYNDLQVEQKATDEEMQKALNILDQLSETEIIELTTDKEKGFEDYLKDLEERQVTYDLGPFTERGTLQADGSIISENGEYVSKESVTNVKQVNAKVKETVSEVVTEDIVVPKKSPELVEATSQLKQAIEKERIAKDALMKKMVKLDNEAIRDNQDLFGKRKSDDPNLLFNERVDPNAINKALEKEKNALKEARSEVKRLTELKDQIKKGKVKSTKEIAFAEVDKIAKKVKDLLPGIKDPDLNVQGFSQDQLIDLIATAVKKLISAGIDVNEAISQVVDSIKAKFGDIDIDIEAIKEKVSPKEANEVEVEDVEAKTTPPQADNEFKSKSGKKSLLNRAAQGGNSQKITDAIEANGLDYKIENREEAKKRAEDFVNEVGTVNALEAVRSNQIKGAEKAFVYSTIVDNLMNEIENSTNESDKQELEKIHADLIADLTNEFSQEGTDAGRFIAALNDIYNSSTLKYNLSKQIESHKASNKGEISDEVLAKFTEADKRIKELENLIKEAEAKAKVAEDELAVKNVQDDIERKKQLANKNKSGLTPREQTRKKELKNKFFGRLNDATSMITMLADPEFREYLGLTFKQAKGDLANFSKRIINELGKGAQAHLPQLFDEAKKSIPTKSNTIKIGKDGKIKIPAQLFRDYVEAGENDIDIIAAKIKDDIAAEFPDADVRDIRDALTGYGKQINPTKDDVSIEIARLKSLGKLISAYEDASDGINPLKSGLNRAKPTQEMRELRKEINRIIKENGLDAVDLEKQWASALDKIKSQLTNQIEDLDKQIANGEKRKVERTTTPLDVEATTLKEIRDAKKQILDDLVGKPELTEEQLIARAEKSLEGAIDKLQKEIAQGQIEYKEKPTTKQSVKLDELRKKRKELVETRNQLREQAGLVEAQRMNVAKKRVRKQIEDLNQRIADKDYSKKVVKPLIEDTELSQLRAEKLRQQEVYDAQKYKDELENRTNLEKWRDAALEIWNIERIIRATGELSTVLIQGGMLTVSRKFTNRKAFAKIMKELVSSLGSAKKAEKLEGLIKVHPNYLLSQKAKLALANPDYKSDVREEQFTGDYANFAWDLPLQLARFNPKFKEFFKKERSVLGDVILNPFKKLTGKGTIGTDKISINNQWKNSNPFRVLERGSTLYMNTLRMEEFVRGCEMLRMEGKNEIDNLADFKLLANAINSMTGRANLPMEVATSSKALAVVFFSARNAVSVVNQVNPAYYLYLHMAGTDGLNPTSLKNKRITTVANKLAITNFMRFVTITGAMILAIKAGAGEDEEGEDVVQVETDPRSSDFMKIKIGNIRFDPWHGMTNPIVLMAKVLTEEVKNINSGKVEKLEDKMFGDKNRFDLLSRFVRNKFSPSAARLANTLSTNAGIDPETGEAIRVTPFGENYEVEGAFENVKPMYWDAVAEIRKENPGALAEFLTVVSIFGWNTSVYAKKVKNSTEEKFLKDQAKKKALFELPELEKDKIRVENKLSPKESEIRRYQAIKTAKQKGLPYYHSMDVVLTKEEVAAIDFNGSDEEIAEALKQIEKAKKEYGIEDEE